jgi:hypothetical protein
MKRVQVIRVTRQARLVKPGCRSRLARLMKPDRFCEFVA